MILFNHAIKINEHSIEPTKILQSKSSELPKGLRRPQSDYDFTNKIEGRSDTCHPHLPVNSLIGNIIIDAPFTFLLGS